MPKVTVVIPTYHHHQYLEQCLGSILLNGEQANIILVPVEGDDDTKERILWLYHDYPLLEDRMEVLYNTKADPIHQMQLGLMATETEYVTFLGSDDFMFPSKLREQVALANWVQGKDMFCLPIINPNLYMADDELKPLDIPKVNDFTMKRMLKSCILTEAALTMTGALKEVGGFYDPKKDWGYLSVYAMWLRLLKTYENHEVIMMKEPYALYRQLHTSRHASRYKTKQDYKDHHQRLKDVAEYYFPKGDR